MGKLHIKLLSGGRLLLNVSILSPNTWKVLETLAMTLLIVLSTYVYSILLDGLPCDLLIDIYQFSKRNFEALEYCWVSEELGKPNDKLAFTVIYALPVFLTLLGADLNTVCLMFLSILWVLGGGSMYLLAKRFSGSLLAGLTAMLIYLGAATALRGLWCSLDTSALYVLTPLVLLTVDEAYKRGCISYGFYTALASSLLSGALAKISNLVVLALTILAYFTARTRRETVESKWVALFLAMAGISWFMMNTWWIAIPPSLSVEGFNPLCLIVFPIATLTFLLLLRMDKMNTVQTLVVIALAMLLMDPRGAMSSNVTSDVLAIISIDVSLLVAIGLKRFSERLSDHISISLAVEGDGSKVREYDLIKPFVFLLASGVIVYQGLTVPLSWTNSLNIPEHYGELSSILPPGNYRILIMPVAKGEVYYSWSSRKYEKPVESLILNRSIVHGCDFTALNNLVGRAEFWKILSALNIKFVVLHYDLDQGMGQAVNSRLIETKLNYSFIVSPNLANGIVNLTSEAVKPLMEDLGFTQLVNFNPGKYFEAEIRYVDVKEAQSEIHLYAYGEAWISEQPNLNQTFSFAYVLSTVSNWLDYNYLEFWIKVNGSNTATVQIQDVFGNWALWQLDLKEEDWNLAVIRLNDAILDTGLDRSRVVAIIFSIHAPLGKIVEAEVGGIFLDGGVMAEVKPLELFEKINQQLTVYRLQDGFEVSKIYVVKEPLKCEGDVFENLLKDDFDPRNKAYVDGEVVQVSYAVVNYIEEDPTRYRITVDDFQERFLIVLNEKFDSGWSLYAGEPDQISMLIRSGHQNVKHVKINGFLNGWYVEAEEAKPLKITIVYKPQLLLEALRIISTVFAISCFTILLFKKRLVGMLKHISTYGEKT